MSSDQDNDVGGSESNAMNAEETDIERSLVSDLLLDRYLRDEASDDEREQVESVLSHPQTKGRLEELKNDDEHFQRNALSFDALVSQRAESDSVSPSSDSSPKRRRRWGGVVAGVGSLAAAAAVFLVVQFGMPDASDAPTTKGSFLKHFVAPPIGVDGVVVASKTDLRPGDRVRFVIDAGRGAFVGVYSLDSASVFTRYAPASNGATGLEQGEGKHAFGNSSVLDDVLGREDWIGVRCSSHVSDREIEKSIREKSDPPTGCEFDRLRVTKMAATARARQP